MECGKIILQCYTEWFFFAKVVPKGTLGINLLYGSSLQR